MGQAANPHLKVHVAFGHYDGATPYFAAEHVLAHLNIPDELRENVDSAYGRMKRRLLPGHSGSWSATS
jgi:hypothetical protein